MKKLILLITLAFVVVQVFSQCADTANIYEFTYKGKKYEIVKERKTWINAAACAVERGGYLAEINDKAEQDTIYSAIIHGAGVSSTYVTINNGGGIAYVWIGATDQHVEGTWLWDGNNDNTGINFWTGTGSNGAAVDHAYYNWGGTSRNNTKEPDNWGSGQNHAAIALAGWPSGSTTLGIPGEWNDIIGTSAVYFVIEYDSTGSGIVTYKEDDFEVYPNPTNGKLYIKGDGIRSIEIIDPAGKIVSYGKHSSIDLSSYKNGSYFLRITIKDRVITKVIIKK